MARSNTAMATVPGENAAMTGAWPKVPKPMQAIIPLVNNRDLKARRRLFAEAVAVAQQNVEAAEERWRRHVRHAAAAPGGPNVGGLDAGRLKREIDDAKAELAAQQEGLASIDEQLKPYATPERQAAAARQRESFRVALDEHWDAIDRLEAMVKGPLVELIGEVYASRKRAAADLGAQSLGIIGDMSGDGGLARRLSELIAGPLIGLLDGQTLGFYIANKTSHHRKWSDCERSHLGSVDLESLE